MIGVGYEWDGSQLESQEKFGEEKEESLSLILMAVFEPNYQSLDSVSD